MAGVDFTREQLIEALEVLAARLADRGAASRLRVVGGAAISIQYGRDATTHDIDALFSRSTDVAEVVAEIASERGWPESWLNDDVTMYASHHDHEAAWTTFLETSDIRIDLAPADLLLAMKLKAGRGRRDEDDIDLLCDACGLASAQDAVDLFDRYYPDDEIKPAARRQIEARDWPTS